MVQDPLGFSHALEADGIQTISAYSSSLAKAVAPERPGGGADFYRLIMPAKPCLSMSES